jgi:RNA polymerase sigma factor (sigma-70 family)
MQLDWFRETVDRYAAPLELYARQWCDTPEDIVQEAFVKLVNQRRRPDSLAAWLFRVVRNGALNASQANRRRRRHEREKAAAECSTWFQVENVPISSEHLDAETVTAELRSLPLEQREVIVAHLWGGLTFEQIGEVSGRSPSTAHRLYCAGLSTMRERLGVTCRKSRPIQN